MNDILLFWVKKASFSYMAVFLTCFPISLKRGFKFFVSLNFNLFLNMIFNFWENRRYHRGRLRFSDLCLLTVDFPVFKMTNLFFRPKQVVAPEGKNLRNKELPKKPKTTHRQLLHILHWTQTMNLKFRPWLMMRKGSWALTLTNCQETNLEK